MKFTIEEYINQHAIAFKAMDKAAIRQAINLVFCAIEANKKLSPVVMAAVPPQLVITSRTGVKCIILPQARN